MTDKTEQKILDAALILFARKGYKGATTRAIAQKAGVSELTLFRKFETKEKLFDQTIIDNQEKLKKKSILIFKDLDQKYEDSKKFLDVYVKGLSEFFDNNFEYFNLMITEDNNNIDIDMGEFTIYIGDFLKRNLKNRKIDYRTLAILINTFLYVYHLEIYHGRTFLKDSNAVEKFIHNLQLCDE
jgi:TetR/AcrR family transcriptional regulator